MCWLLPTYTGALPCSSASLPLSSASIAPDTSVAAAAWSQHSHPWPHVAVPAHIRAARHGANPAAEGLAGAAHAPTQAEPQHRLMSTARGILPLGFFTITSTDRVRPSSRETESLGCVGHWGPRGWAWKGGEHKWDGCFSPGRVPEFKP